MQVNLEGWCSNPTELKMPQFDNKSRLKAWMYNSNGRVWDF